MDHTSAGAGGIWWWSGVFVVELDDTVVVAVIVSEEDIFVCSMMLVSPLRIPFRSEAVGVDILSSFLQMIEAATMYDWLVC